MNRHLLLPLFCLLILVSLLAAPVLAATVTCPSGCSCLLPAEAKKLGLAGYCNGKQAVCGYDSAKNEKYCYEKSSALLPVDVVTTTKPVVATTTTKATVTTTRTTAPVIAGPTRLTAVTCPDTCECLPEEKAQGAATPLSLCGGTKSYCGSTGSGTSMYCYTKPPTVITTTPTTTTPVVYVRPEPCSSGCSCLSMDKADAAGLKRCSDSTRPCDYDPAGRPMQCYVLTTATTPKITATALSPSPTGTTLVPMRLDITPRPATEAPAPNVFSSFGTFVATLFGGREAVGAGSGSSRIIVCPFGLTSCNGACIDLRNDPENCGQCGVLCPGQLPLCCNGTCSSMISAENCRTCGNACPADRPCTMVEGWPTCSVDGCNDLFSYTDCGTGVCVHLDMDTNHCGRCGNACPDHSYCNWGVCTPCGAGYDRCGEGGLAGGGYCFNLTADPWNCGACGNPCGPGDICRGGTCVPCPAGTERCGMNCVDLSTDRLSCGSCGNYCYDNVLSGGTTCCDGSCTNLQTNMTHCGTCGNSCGENQRCIGGVCALMPTGTVEVTCRLGQTACGMTCRDLESDELNCGACGRACMSGRVCIDGECLQEGGEDGCGLGQIRCGGRCVYPETNRANCGRCGHVCPDWYTCRESTCTPAYSGDEAICDDPGLDYCSGDCADLRTSERHCGRCGNSCTGGSCIDGTCYYLNSDRANCGSVGHRCASGEICCYGTCRAEDTGDPERCACSAAPCRASDGLGCCNGYCWALNTDSANCGSCGHECTGEERCCGGRCTSMRWDEDNCGWCGHDCPWNKECQNGRCCLWGTTWGCD